jgi:hypothetical protein
VSRTQLKAQRGERRRDGSRVCRDLGPPSPRVPGATASSRRPASPGARRGRGGDGSRRIGCQPHGGVGDYVAEKKWLVRWWQVGGNKKFYFVGCVACWNWNSEGAAGKLEGDLAAYVPIGNTSW